MRTNRTRGEGRGPRFSVRYEPALAGLGLGIGGADALATSETFDGFAGGFECIPVVHTEISGVASEIGLDRAIVEVCDVAFSDGFSGAGPIECLAAVMLENGCNFLVFPESLQQRDLVQSRNVSEVAGASGHFRYSVTDTTPASEAYMLLRIA